MKKNNLKELLNNLKTLEARLPLGDTKSYLDTVLENETKSFTDNLKNNPTVKFLDEFNTKLEKFKKDFDLKQVVSEIEAIQQDIEATKETFSNEFASQKESSTQNVAKLSELIKGVKNDLSSMTTKEIKSLLGKVSKLEEQINFQDSNSKETGKSLKETMQSFDMKLAELSKSIENDKATFTKSTEDRFSTTESVSRETLAKIEELRKELFDKLANVKGGGNMNRQIKVGGTVMSNKWTDINFVAGANTTITATDDNTDKNVDITITASGGGAGTLAEVSAGSTDATKSLYTMTDTVNVVFETAGGVVILTINETNEQVNLLNGTAALPALTFGATDNGIYGSGGTSLRFSMGGSHRWSMSGTEFQSATTGGAYLLRSAASSTVPAHAFVGDENTGMGTSGADALNLITGGTSRLAISSAGNVTIPTGSLAVKFDSGFQLDSGVMTLLRSTTGNSDGSSAILFTGATNINKTFSFKPAGTLTQTSGVIGFGEFHGTFGAGAGSANFRPMSFIYTINNSGAQSGTATGIFLNATETALNSMTHNLLDLQVAGSSKFKVGNTGVVTLVQVDNAATPTLSFGDGDTGFFESTDDVLELSLGNNEVMSFFKSGGDLRVGLEAAGRLLWSSTADPNGTADISLRRLAAGSMELRSADAVTNAVTYGLDLNHQTSGTAAVGFGNGISVTLENASGTEKTAATQEFTWSDATNATEDAQWVVKLINNGSLSTILTATSAGNITAGNGLFAPSSGVIGFTTRGRIQSPSDGVLRLSNAGETDFNRLQFGLTNNTCPAIKRSTTGFALRLADDSASTWQLASLLVEANTAGSGSPNIITEAESGTVFTNEGTTAANYHTLPTAVAGLTFTFYVDDADGIVITANTSDIIQINGVASSAAGTATSTDIGSSITLTAINAVDWVATSVVGTWTLA